MRYLLITLMIILGTAASAQDNCSCCTYTIDIDYFYKDFFNKDSIVKNSISQAIVYTKPKGSPKYIQSKFLFDKSGYISSQITYHKKGVPKTRIDYLRDNTGKVSHIMDYHLKKDETREEVPYDITDYTYDGKGYLITVKAKTYSRINEYNKDGNTISEVIIRAGENGDMKITIDYEYNANLVTKKLYRDGQLETISENIVNNNRLEKITNLMVGWNNEILDQETYSYHDNGKVKNYYKTSPHAGDECGGPDIHEDFFYNSHGLLEKIFHKHGEDIYDLIISYK